MLETRAIKVEWERWRWLQLPNLKGVGGISEKLPPVRDELIVQVDWEGLAEDHAEIVTKSASGVIIKQNHRIAIRDPRGLMFDKRGELLKLINESINKFIEEGGTYEEIRALCRNV